MLLAAEIPTWIGELAFGSVVMLALLGYVWFKPGVDRLVADKEKAEAQRDALIEAYQEEIIPALRDATVGSARVAQVAEEASRTNREAAKILDQVRTLLLARREGT